MNASMNENLSKNRRQKKMKQGRPRDPTKSVNRRCTVVLTPKANTVFKKVCSIKGSKWFHEYVSKQIIKDFLTDPTPFIVEQIKEFKKERDAIESKIRDLVKVLEEIKQNEEDRKQVIEIKR
jgi:hypothetical protein